MNEKEIRLEILKIQKKYYTPTSKIAEACDVDRSLLSRMLNQTFDRPMYSDILVRLEKWLEDRKVDNQY